MKVRTKFTILISFAAFISVIFFCSHLYFELKEGLYELIDFELEEAATAIYEQIEGTGEQKALPTLEHPGFLLENYWLHVYTDSGKTLLATKLVQHARIPTANTSKGYFVTLPISHDLLNIPDSSKDEIANDRTKLRARMFSKQIAGENVIVHIAKPILVLNSELQELVLDMTWGIPLTIFFIIIIAYFIAGRILRPLSVINSNIVKIREQSLHERIPLGKSRDELYTLTSSLNSMFDRLENSFQSQRDFISNASHEMKSPLTILMLGHEEMLFANQDMEIRKSLEKQLHSMQRLNKLIRDLLNIARLEQQDTITREPVNLKGLILHTLDDYAEIINDKNITITYQLDPLNISVDYEKIQRLLINVIDNGIKYNHPQNGFIHIFSKSVNDSALIEISNSGKTIPPDDIGHIFKQFYRVEKSRSQPYGGTGLGLTIARPIVEMHGGNIEVSSVDNTTTFTIVLPRAVLS